MTDRQLKTDQPYALSMIKATPVWLWQLLAATILCGGTMYILVPMVYLKRGYSAVGGEWMIGGAAFVLPFSLLRKH